MNNLKCPICKSEFVATVLGDSLSFEQIEKWSSHSKEEVCIKAEPLKGPIRLDPNFGYVYQNCAYSAKVKDFKGKDE